MTDKEKAIATYDASRASSAISIGDYSGFAKKFATANKKDSVIASFNKRLEEERRTEKYKKIVKRENDTAFYNDEQKKAYYEVINSPDFEEFSEKGLAIENPDPDAASLVKGVGAYDLNSGWGKMWRWDGVNNKATYAKAALNQDSKVALMDSEYLRYTKLTDAEVSIYSYYLAKEGQERADEYLKSIETPLNARIAGVYTEAMGDSNVAKIGYSFGAGMEQYVRGLQGWITDEPLNPSAMQIAGTKAREDLLELGPRLPQALGGGSAGQMAYDTTQAIGNMFPSIMLSFIPAAGPWLSAASVGVSSGGNARQEMIKEGASPGDATEYGVYVGLAEAVLSKLLSVVSRGAKTNGLSDKLASKLTGNMKSGVARALVTTGVNAGANAIGEGFEEGMQEFLSPVFKKIATGEEFEGFDWEEIFYSAAVGALTGVAMDGGVTAVNKSARLFDRTFYNEGKKIAESEHTDAALIDAASKAENENINRTLAKLKKVTQGSNKYYQLLGKLSNQVTAEFGKTLSEQLTLDEQRYLGGDAAVEEYFWGGTEFEKSARNYLTQRKDAEEAIAIDDVLAAAVLNNSRMATPENKYGSWGAEAYRNGLEGYEGTETQFRLWFELARNLGLKADNRSLHDMINTLSEEDRSGLLKLDNETLNAAFNLGLEYMDNLRIAEIKANSHSKGEGSPGVSSVERVKISENAKKSLGQSQLKAIKRLQALSRLLSGYSFVVETAEDNPLLIGANGYIDQDHSVIHINIEAGRVIEQIGDYALDAALTHEVGHGIKENAPRLFEELKSFVHKEFFPGQSWDAIVERRQRQYQDALNAAAKKNNTEARSFTWEDAEEEVVCNSLGKMLTSKRVMESLSTEHKSLFGRIWRAIKNFFARITGRMSSAGEYANKTTEQRIVEQGVKSKQAELERLFVNALKAANTNAAARSDARLAAKDRTTDDSNAAKSSEKSALTNTNSQNVHVSGENFGDLFEETNTDVDSNIKYALPYDVAIDNLVNGTLDTTQNTHLRVLEHTPQIYIDKAGASDREIVMAWDIAYLAMNKNGDILGNYHGLGAEVMKALPVALEDPLYIVKQKNGRIAAVTKMVVKGKRAVFASIELEAYQTTIQEGEPEANKYNLVVTVTDAKPNYLQNTIFGGEIVYNKNNEDPTHFILRLKSLEKAVPTYDLAESSNNIIPDSAEKINSFAEKSSQFPEEVTSVLSQKQVEALSEREIRGDDLLDAADLAREILAVDGEITADAKAVLYHGTTHENAKKIIASGKMFGKEDALFFSTKKDGIVLDYGEAVVEAQIPLERLRLNDVFDDEVHLTMAVKPNTLTNIRFSRADEAGKISEGMSDEARYELLKNRKLYNIPTVTDIPAVVLEKIPEISSWEDINKYLGKDKRSLIQKLTKEFGIFDKEYYSEDIELSFEFSGNNFRESYNKQGHNYIEFAKMFFVFDAVIEGAVGVEVHNRTDYKPDPTLDRVFVLIGAYQDGDFIVPAKLEVKQFKDKQNTLYVAISLDKIKKTEVWKQGNTENGVTQNSRSVNISIARIFEKINPSDKNFIKYIPDGFLNQEQRAAKKTALTEDLLKNRPSISKSLADKLNREALADAFLTLAETDEERVAVRKYRQEIDKLDVLIDERGALQRRFDKLKGKKGLAGERTEVNARIKAIDDYITRHDAKLLELSTAKPLRDLVSRAQRQTGSGASKSTATEVTMSRGKLNRERAEFMHDKVYTKKDAQSALEKINDFKNISGKTKNELFDELWQGLNGIENEFERTEFVRTMADKVLDRLQAEAMTENPNYIESREMAAYFKGYVGRLSFSEDIKAEINHKLDKDGSKAFLGRWGNKRSDKAPTPADVFVTEFARENPGYEYLEDMNAADALFEIDGIYDRISDIEKKVSAYDEASPKELAAIKGDVVNKLLDAFKGGRPSTRAKAVTAAQNKAAEAQMKLEKERVRSREKYEETVNYYKATLALDRLARSIRDMKLGTFDNATQVRGDKVMGLLRELAKFEYRRTFSPNNVREKVRGLSAWYTKENPMLGWDGKDNHGQYLQGVKDKLSAIADGSGALSIAELGDLYDIMGYFKHFAETYNKVYYKGKWVDAPELAKGYIDKLAESYAARGTWLSKFLGFAPIRSYLDNFSDPLSVVSRYDSYIDDGFFTSIFRMLQDAAVERDIALSDVLSEYNDFLFRNPDYAKNLQTEYVYILGNQVPKSQAIALYMTLKQKDAQAGVVYNGFEYTDFAGNIVETSSAAKVAAIEFKRKTLAKKMVEEQGISENEAYERTGAIVDDGFDSDFFTPEEISAYSEAIRAIIAEKLTALDREIISIEEREFNETLRNMKYDTDIERMGFSNVRNSYYFPIKRAGIAERAEQISYADELQSVSNISANKNRVAGARQTLALGNFMSIYERHASAICTYAKLQSFVDFFDKIYNLDIGGNPNAPLNVRRTADKIWGKKKNARGNLEESGNYKYFTELIEDVQGLRLGRDNWMDKAVGWFRTGSVVSALGLNGKVLVSQLTSYGAAAHILDVASLTKAVGAVLGKSNVGTIIFTEEGRARIAEFGKVVDEFCPIAKLRHEENQVYMAQAVLVKKNGKITRKGRAAEVLEKAQNVIMKPIGWVDRAVICTLFEACKYSVARNGPAFNTEENLIEAGKLLKRVILDTQQNSIATERSRAMRSTSELQKAFTMFSADSMKTMGRVLDSVGRVFCVRKRLANEKDATRRLQLETELKHANLKMAKSLATLAANSAFMAAVALMFSALRGKLDDDESVIEVLAKGFGENLIGGLPIIRDIVSKIIDGYDMNHYTLETVSSLADTVRSILTTAGKIFDGEADGRDIVRVVRKLAFSLGQALGIPVRNVWNTIYGFIKNLFPDTADAIDKFFK